MKNKVVLLLLLLLGAFNINAQESLNQVNRDGERIGVWKKYHRNGRIRYQGQFKNGVEVGVFKFYSMESSDHPIMIKTFTGKINEATIKYYSEEGILESVGEMIGKERNGKWVYYFKDGKTIISEENYDKGILNGTSSIFYKTGKTAEILNYIDGKLDGSVKRFADNGVLIDDLIYSKGKLNGLAKYFNLDGKLIYSGIYENDEKIGEWEFYKDGKPSDTIKQ